MNLIISQTDKNTEYIVRNSITADNISEADHDFLRQVISSFFAQSESRETQEAISITKVDSRPEAEEVFVMPVPETVPADFMINDKYWKQTGGAKGSLILDCPVCGNQFGTFLREPQSSIQCKCGAEIELDTDLARFSYVCKECGATRYGKTNSQDATIASKCVCKAENTLQWDKEKREYVAL